jgi:hypothetical protein
MTAPDGFRDRFLRAVVLFGVALLAITEGLSAFGAVHRTALLLCWMFVGVAVAWRTGGSFRFTIPDAVRDPVVALAVLGTTAILVLTAITAGFSPPNSADAMAYHMPRVVYWAEQGSVRFFPTPYLNQIMLQPLAEYFMLHGYVISGGDRWVNFVQWFGSLGSIIGISAIAGTLGAGARGQALAALFCATLPSGILASSGAKNDYFLAMWIVAAVYFAARFVRSPDGRDAAMLGSALGLALLTKATAYLFVPWLVVAVMIPYARGMRARAIWLGAAALGCALALNAPHYVRNFQLSGSILGFDSAQGDGFFRWRNETFGWKQTASNVLRNVSEQLGGRSETWNQGVYEWTVRAHQRLGIEVNDPATTWRGIAFSPPVNANHEANANNKWHLLILGIAGGIVSWRAFRRHTREASLYGLALVCGFGAFCTYLKWQPFEARLFLPLFVAGAAVVGVALDGGQKAGWWSAPTVWVQVALCFFLLSVARLPVLENWVRPLRGPRSVLRVARDDQYFADMTQWNNRPYKESVGLLAGLGCPLIGIDATNLSLEYPLMALLREKKPGTQFVHTGVQNASSRYRAPVEGEPCAIVCLDCAGDDRRKNLYSAYAESTVVNPFVVFRK